MGAVDDGVRGVGHTGYPFNGRNMCLQHVCISLPNDLLDSHVCFCFHLRDIPAHDKGDYAEIL